MAEDTENPRSECETNPLEYPEKYFELQVAFAKRWADITGTPFTETLLRNTDLYRLVTSTYPQTHNFDVDSRWTDATMHVKDTDIKHITYAIFDVYANQAHSRYQIPKSNEKGRFGPFSYVVGDWLNTPRS